MNSKIIVVTGGNRGIGLEIARQLARRGAQVILTARQAKAGQEAVRKLAREELKAQFHALDVTKEKGITGLRDFIERQAGHLDVLINNAGMLDDRDTDPWQVPLEVVRATVETNTLGPLRLAQAMSGLLRQSKGPRMVNVSSGMGSLSGMGSDHAAYRLSKAGLNALTIMLAADSRIAVNAMCPGWVRTDMGGPNAERDVTQGADSAVWLALDAPQNLTGKLIRDRKVVEW